ncbi:hypothetical protein TVAG_133460 [Trichomonas vaginalis G3]|uniref:Uncharacterized protein n=1 Tax=Trichomonas vaginalis (strain ATCC PRA-98 / G3) TaxID=412133 RepID=A2EDM3_TRIV3|nr:hypothetical protein TVAGG3_0906240 [Trichomonas vaginalis G3]EAY09288.1 hypothetical protein TVAG_133460 [Trichomonas vaginalis G3]KAI5484073.1 hypothetical protein TVAGG3_0906240 [Trichomonas vaginalis G3]|eukprot:XP_001321511.1 hypothetical protein [Trichomonas vaginalis G3]
METSFNNNYFNALKFTKFDQKNTYSIIYSDTSELLSFESNFVSGIEGNTYLLNVGQVYIENNTLEYGITFLYEKLHSNKSNIYTENVVFPSFSFVPCNLPPAQKLATYVIVLISISALVLISILALVSIILIKNKRITKIQSKISLNTTIIDDFG